MVHQIGRLINDPASVGGFGSLRGGTPPPDTDRDGMPDAWERGQGLEPGDPSDVGRTDYGDANGYTNTDKYLNELAGG